MSGEQDFLDDFVEADAADVGTIEPAEATEPPVKQPVEEASVQAEAKGDGPPRGPDGKFIKKEAAQVAEEIEKGVKEDLAEVPPADSEGTMVPVSVVQALREEIKGLKAANAEPKPEAPEFVTPQADFQSDPVGAFQGQLHNQKMQMSQFMAVQEYDQETVNAAWHAFDQACQSDPAVSALSYQLINHPHPLGEMVKWHRQQQEVSMLQDAGGLDALIEAKLAERLAQQPEPTAVQPSAVTPATPPSLAKRGGGAQASEIESEKDFFAATFKR